jgi:hypothetical protein
MMKRDDLDDRAWVAWACATVQQNLVKVALIRYMAYLLQIQQIRPDTPRVVRRHPRRYVERSLYARAVGYNYEAVKIFMPANRSKSVYAKYIEHVPPDVTAGIFWMKNRDPQHWRDAQQLEHVLGKYIISDKPMSEEEWARERAGYPIGSTMRGLWFRESNPTLLEACRRCWLIGTLRSNAMSWGFDTPRVVTADPAGVGPFFRGSEGCVARSRQRPSAPSSKQPGVPAR